MDEEKNPETLPKVFILHQTINSHDIKEKEKENIKLMDLLYRFEEPIESRNHSL